MIETERIGISLIETQTLGLNFKPFFKNEYETTVTVHLSLHDGNQILIGYIQSCNDENGIPIIAAFNKNRDPIEEIEVCGLPKIARKMAVHAVIISCAEFYEFKLISPKTHVSAQT